MHNQAHHPVPFLDGQDDIPRSDGEGDSPDPNRGASGSPAPVDSTNIVPPSDPSHFVLGTQPMASALDLAAQIPPAPIHPDLPIPENLPRPSDLGSLPPPNPLSLSNQLAPSRPNSPASAPNHHIMTPDPPLAVPISAPNPSLHSLGNLEQQQNERRRRLASLDNVSLCGPPRRHVNNYASNLYARTKPHIYHPNPKASNSPDNSKKYQAPHLPPKSQSIQQS
ncbi:hypothetical protein RSAG8_13295, partial [Rhizoctonia solani AG-8 WAC10335]